MTSSTTHPTAGIVAQDPITLPTSTWRMLANANVRPELPKGLDAFWAGSVGIIRPMLPRRHIFMRRAQQVAALDKDIAPLSDTQLREQLWNMRATFRLGRDRKADVIRAFALIREAAWRTLGLKPYVVQLAAALAMERGCIVQAATGEGKTLMATMPAAIEGWRGRGCHVMTVNDYLAKRDADWNRPLYDFCGLTVAHIDGEMFPPMRRMAYYADVTYCTNKEVAADYLRDRLRLGQTVDLPTSLLGRYADDGTARPNDLLMRGLPSAIIDEADSLLIDEAVTPLIISGEAPNAEQTDAYTRAAELAGHMVTGEDYRLNRRYREIHITRSGRDKLAALTDDWPGIWAGSRRREELVSQALTARDVYTRGKQYVIQDGKIVIVDEFTGRLMPDRTWRDGLHSAVEAKEGLEVQPPKDTLARISFQKFYRLYKRLSGMTGTAVESWRELWLVYRRPVVTIPTNKPCIRTQASDGVFMKADDKWGAIVEGIALVHATGRPILVGTRSVRASEHLSKMLNEQQLEHQVLNAVHHHEEAAIVARAGERDRITVATNMAGRGTDIKLGKDVVEMGGLAVIATERHEAGRIDRQLYGRAGRQGDPGSAIAFVSFEDELVQRYASRWILRVIKALGPARSPLRRVVDRRLFRKIQARAERISLRQRRGVLRADDWLEEFLGFAGRDV